MKNLKEAIERATVLLEGETKIATFYKKSKELEYYTSSNTTTRVANDSTKRAKDIIKNSGVKQVLKIV